jgi:hypothetical protein
MVGLGGRFPVLPVERANLEGGQIDAVECDPTTMARALVGLHCLLGSLTFPVDGARARAHAEHGVRARVRVDWVARQQDHSLKEVIAVGTVVLAGKHAAELETGGRSHTGKDRCDRASREALSSRSQRGLRV